MNKTQKIITVTLWAGRLLAVAVVILLFTLKPLMDWYCNFRELTDGDKTVITVAFFFSALVIFGALWNIDALLRRLLRQKVFIPENVVCLRRVQWCCALVSLACFAASFAYLPLIFLAVVMVFVFLAMAVGACILDAAVALREENDLTI